MKAAAFLMAAMPDLQIINVMAAGISDPNWPNEPKAHLMMAYLKENYVEATTLLRVGARRLKYDVEDDDRRQKRSVKKRITSFNQKIRSRAEYHLCEWKP
jgi:hypothetical protein